MARAKTVARRALKGTAVKSFCLSMPAVGHSVSLPAPPDFGQVRFTLAQQADKPTEAMTRVVKDVLRVGRWKVGLDESGKPVFWNVTPQVLASLSQTTKARLASGDAINFGKSHGDEDLLIPTDELIAPIDDVLVSGDVLWVSAYVTPAQAEYLANPSRKVSVGVLDNYTAGDGQQYPLALAHVAVTDRPVVTGQGRFMALANSIQGSKTMDFAALVEAINKLLASADLGSLPETVDESTIVIVIETMAAANGGAESPAEEPADASGGEPAADPMAGLANMGGGIGMSNKSGNKFMLALSNMIDAKIKPLTDEIGTLKSERVGEAKAAFEARLTELGKSGVPAITLTNKRALGAKYGYDLALLDGVVGTIKMSNTSQRNADGSAPTVPGDAPAVATDAEIEARLKARGIDTSKMPKFGV